MDGLPAELIDQICDCLSGDVESSKNLRVVARRFSRTAQYIFHTLILYPHGDQWRDLNNIAQVPASAKFVHTIKLVRERDLPIYGSFESFKHWTEPLRHMILDAPNVYTGSLATTTASEMEAILRQAHKAYAYWSVGSNQIKVWHAQASRYCQDRNTWIPPQLQLDRLSNFQTLQTIGHADLCMLNSAGRCFGREVDYITRQESETLIAYRWRQNEAEDNNIYNWPLQIRGDSFPKSPMLTVPRTFILPIWARRVAVNAFKAPRKAFVLAIDIPGLRSPLRDHLLLSWKSRSLALDCSNRLGTVY